MEAVGNAEAVDFDFDFETQLEPTPSAPQARQQVAPLVPAGAPIGQSIGNYKKNYRQTVCTYWLKGLCMKGESCGFLHEWNPERMPVCRTLLKHGVCREPDCPYKHSLEEIKECNMYKLGFCVYGPTCRYRHTRLPGPPPDPSTVEAAKPRDHRNINVVLAHQGSYGGRGRPALMQRPYYGARPQAAPPGVPQLMNFPHAGGVVPGVISSQ